MKINELIEKTGAEVINLANSDLNVTGCHIGDLLSLVMSKANDGDVWLTVQTNVNVAAVSVLVDISCIIVVEGMTPDNDLVNKAKEQGVNLLKSEKSAYEIAKILANEI